MDEMRELVTVDAFGRALGLLIIAWLIAGIAGTIIARRRSGSAGMARGLLWTALGPIAYALWRLHLWMVRVDPETGYVGLHRVSVFAISAAVFVAVGLIAGLTFARLYRGSNADVAGAGAESEE